MKLSPKETIFVNTYLCNNFNGTQAAITAGYSAKSAVKTASRILSKPHVKLYVQAQKQKLVDKLEITQEKVMKEIARVAFSDIRKFFDDKGRLVNITDLDEDTAAVLGSVETDEIYESNGRGARRTEVGVSRKVKLWDKIKALEMLAKHFKIFDDSDAGINLNVTIKKGGKRADGKH